MSDVWHYKTTTHFLHKAKCFLPQNQDSQMKHAACSTVILHHTVETQFVLCKEAASSHSYRLKVYSWEAGNLNPNWKLSVFGTGVWYHAAFCDVLQLMLECNIAQEQNSTDTLTRRKRAGSLIQPIQGSKSRPRLDPLLEQLDPEVLSTVIEAEMGCLERMADKMKETSDDICVVSRFEVAHKGNSQCWTGSVLGRWENSWKKIFFSLLASCASVSGWGLASLGGSQVHQISCDLSPML